jgi:hypothetical protein
MRSRGVRRVFAVTAGVILASACANPEGKAVRASYDPATARLIQLSADQDGDGAIDQWTYMNGNFPLRGEADTNRDGRIDRWEYFDVNAKLIMIGSSSFNDGIEDTQTYVAAQDGLRRVDISHRRDRVFDRRELYRDAQLAQVIEDTNFDGRPDKWERYEGATLREAAFDTSFANARPDTRMVFDERGHFVAIEQDRERDGSFVRLTGAAAETAKAGVAK